MALEEDDLANGNSSNNVIYGFNFTTALVESNSSRSVNVSLDEDDAAGVTGGGGGGEDLSTSIRYAVIVPILVACCLVTFCMNAYIIAAFPLIRNLSRVRKTTTKTRPTLVKTMEDFAIL